MSQKTNEIGLESTIEYSRKRRHDSQIVDNGIVGALVKVHAREIGMRQFYHIRLSYTTENLLRTGSINLKKSSS